jgi:phosphomevalonate kinase
MGEEQPVIDRVSLPEGVVVTVFAARTSAVTAGFVARVRALATGRRSAFEPHMKDAIAGARDAVEASSIDELVASLRLQRNALAIVGDEAGVPIVTPEVRSLAELAERTGAFFGPSGAGGGDVAFWTGAVAPSATFVAEASALGYDALACGIGAPGAAECPR